MPGQPPAMTAIPIEVSSMVLSDLGLSSFPTTPAQVPPDCNHRREPRSENLLAEPVSTELVARRH